jgi:transglutaminase-like putative cysteine protease
MLVAGLATQAAMWAASHRACYPVGAALLVLVVSTTSLERTTWSPTRRRFATAVKLAACLSVIAAGAAGVVASALHDGKPPSTVDAIGVLLLIAHLVQTATMTSRRDVALSAPLVAAMLLQAGFAAGGSAPAVLVATVVAAIAAGMVSLAMLHRAELLARDGKGVNLGAPARRALAQAGGAAACGALVFMLLPTSIQVAARAQPRGPTASTSPIDLRSRAPLSDTAVFVTDGSAPAYWQGAIYDHYDGTTWSITRSATTMWAAGDDSPAQAAPVEAAGQRNSRQVSRTDRVEVVAPQPLHAVFAPGQAVSYLGPGGVESDAVGNVTLVNGPAARRTYQVQSVQPAVTPAELRATNGTDPVDQRWLQLPMDLPSRVSTLAAQVAEGKADRESIVEAVESYLRSHETYDLDAPAAAPGSDAVADFLLDSHRGFCEQFASAAVVMLRTLGVPARLVAGYAHGDSASQPGKTVFRESDAHAWVQVWYRGVGWVNSDATPAAAATDVLEKPATSVAAASGHPHRWTPLALAAVIRNAAAGLRPVPGGIAAAVVVSLSVGLVFAVRRPRATQSAGSRAAAGDPTSARPATFSAPPRPVLAAYLRLADSTNSANPRGGPATARTQTMREAAVRLGTHASSVPEMQRALDLLERECYGAERLSEMEIDAAVAAFGRLLPA